MGSRLMMRLRTRQVDSQGDYLCSGCACTKELRSRGVTFCYWGSQKRRRRNSSGTFDRQQRMEACSGLAKDLATGNWPSLPTGNEMASSCQEEEGHHEQGDRACSGCAEV